MNTANSAPEASFVNHVKTRTGKIKAVCEFCNKRSKPVSPRRSGCPDLFELGIGWSSCGYPHDFRHADGSTGSLFCCPACNKLRDSGHSLFFRGGLYAA